MAESWIRRFEYLFISVRFLVWFVTNDHVFGCCCRVVKDKPPVVVVDVGGATGDGGGATGGGGGATAGGGGATGGGGGATGGGGGPKVVRGPMAAGIVGGSGISGGSGEGARAAAIAGAFLGILAAASGIMWAGYKLKPGLLAGVGAGGGGGGGSGGARVISSPSAGAGGGSGGAYHLVAGGASGGAASGGASAGQFASGGTAAGGGYSNVVVTRMDAMNGATTTGLGMGAAGSRLSTMGTQTAGASGGASSANFVDYFSSMSAVTASGGAGSGIANFVGGGARITRAAQTDLPYYGGTLATGYVTESMAMNAAASGGMLTSTSSYYQQQQNNAAMAGGGGGYGTMDNQTIVVDELPPPTLTRGMTAYESQVGVVDWLLVYKMRFTIVWWWTVKIGRQLQIRLPFVLKTIT